MLKICLCKCVYPFKKQILTLCLFYEILRTFMVCSSGGRYCFTTTTLRICPSAPGCLPPALFWAVIGGHWKITLISPQQLAMESKDWSRGRIKDDTSFLDILTLKRYILYLKNKTKLVIEVVVLNVFRVLTNVITTRQHCIALNMHSFM